MSTESIRILLVEDQALVRAGVRKVLETVPEFQVVGEAENGEEMMRALRRAPADLVVLDLNMPKRDGFEAMRDLQAFDPAIKVLVLSLHDDPLYVGRAVREGAQGYLLKDSAVEDLPAAVRAVMEGRPFYSPRAQAALADAMRKGSHMTPLELLTARELEVLKRVAAGLSSRQIGEALEISARTVESHRATLMRKLDLHSVAELTRFALEHGVLPPP